MDIPTRFLALAAGAGLALATGVAHSQQLSHKDGLLVLPNVRVEMAAVPVATTSRATRAEAGLRAYRDEQTGRLRQPSSEEIIIEAAQAPSSNDPTGATITVLPNGRARAILDDSFMSNSVVQRLDNGRLVMRCVAGDSQANAWLRQVVSTTTEAHHDE